MIDFNFNFGLKLNNRHKSRQDLHNYFVLVQKSNGQLCELRRNKLIWQRKTDLSNALRNMCCSTYYPRDNELEQQQKEAFQKWKQETFSIMTLKEYLNG